MGALNRLSAAKVKNAPPGSYCDGGGLWLIKRKDGGAQWVLRVTIHGRRREMGLGNLQSVSLKEAREAAAIPFPRDETTPPVINIYLAIQIFKL